MFPRHDWMEPQFGRKAESMRPIMEYARNELKNDENLGKLDEDVRRLKEAALQFQI